MSYTVFSDASASHPRAGYPIPSGDERAARMYRAALEIARKKIAGGPDAPFFKTPYIDAAYNGRLFLWDTCLIATWAKYHTDLIPIEAALDNFYLVQDEDGWIGREYDPDGKPAFGKSHPVSINPPLLAWAELELKSVTGDLNRLRKVYPHLKRHHEYLLKTYRCEDGLFFSDRMGSGMDTIPRWPQGWEDDGAGIKITEYHECVRQFCEWGNSLWARWNVQGRAVDFSAQMALNARCLAEIAGLLSLPEAEILEFKNTHREIARTINELCWSEDDGFYFDLGYGQKIPRWHIGAFWTLLAGVATGDRSDRLVQALKDPKKFGRPTPFPALAADDPDYRPWGEYWLGGVWPPTTYMILRGLELVGESAFAREAAHAFYNAAAEVFDWTGTFWENYAPEHPSFGHPAKPDFCGWSALIPITLWREYLQNS